MTFKAGAVTGILGCLFSAFASAAPLAAEEGVHIKDNLQSKTAISSPVGLRILDTLRKFKTAYEAGDLESFRTLFSNDFRMIYIFGDKKSKSLDLNEFSQGIGRQLNVSFSHLKADQENNIISAVTRIRYRGKWFSHNELVIFFFKKNAPDKIKGVISTPIYSASYPKGNVSIFVIDAVPRTWIKKVLSEPLIDVSMDKLLSNKYDSFPSQWDVSILFVFREPPRVGSVVKTEIYMDAGADGDAHASFKYKVESAKPFFVIHNDALLHSSSADVTMSVYVDGVLIEEKTMH